MESDIFRGITVKAVDDKERSVMIFSAALITETLLKQNPYLLGSEPDFINRLIQSMQALCNTNNAQEAYECIKSRDRDSVFGSIAYSANIQKYEWTRNNPEYTEMFIPGFTSLLKPALTQIITANAITTRNTKPLVFKINSRDNITILDLLSAYLYGNNIFFDDTQLNESYIDLIYNIFNSFINNDEESVYDCPIRFTLRCLDGSVVLCGYQILTKAKVNFSSIRPISQGAIRLFRESQQVMQHETLKQYEISKENKISKQFIFSCCILLAASAFILSGLMLSNYIRIAALITKISISSVVIVMGISLTAIAFLYAHRKNIISCDNGKCVSNKTSSSIESERILQQEMLIQ
jgi:hypothetical protein